MTKIGNNLIEENLLVQEIRIAARPQTIFAFLVEPAKMERWMGMSAQLNPEPGGICRVIFDEKNIMLGSYLEIVPYERVVFSWGMEGKEHDLPPGSTTVEITLQEEGETTLVRLQHRGLPSAASRELHMEGWQECLSRLLSNFEAGDPASTASLTPADK